MNKKSEQPISKESGKVTVRVRGDHPHTGKIGWIPIRAGIPETVNMFGNLMIRVEFPDCTGCYAEQRHLELLENSK